MKQHALSASNQQKIVVKYITQNGSANRYEADAIGVCHLAARIKELKYKGITFSVIDETVTDPHEIVHKRVRRYSIDWKSISPEATEYFKEWLK